MVDGSDALPVSIVTWVTTLIQEGALRRACAALLQDPPGSADGRCRYLSPPLPPGPPMEDHVNMNSLRRVAARAAPTAETDQVRKALFSFPSTSGAGRSGLRSSLVRDAMHPASDLLLQLFFEVVNLLLQGELSEAVRSYVCGASGSYGRSPQVKPSAVRRFPSKVAVDLITERARVILELLQLGVTTSNGCEAIIHTARQWLHRHRSDPS